MEDEEIEFSEQSEGPEVGEAEPDEQESQEASRKS